MRVSIPSPAWFYVGALVWALSNPFPEVASAQIPKKPDQKCINNINKGAAKVAKA